MKKPKRNETQEDYGFMGLYGGLRTNDIQLIKGLSPNQSLFSSMEFTELAANYFRITQTEEKLKREKILGTANKKRVYFEVGKKVRQTIIEIGNLPPEYLPIKVFTKKI